MDQTFEYIVPEEYRGRDLQIKIPYSQSTLDGRLLEEKEFSIKIPPGAYYANIEKRKLGPGHDNFIHLFSFYPEESKKTTYLICLNEIKGSLLEKKLTTLLKKNEKKKEITDQQPLQSFFH